MEKEKIILSTSDEAASIQTVTGWVSRNGRFFGDDERAARVDGQTHFICKICQMPTPGNTWTVCSGCREQKEKDIWKSFPRKYWDGKAPLYSLKYNKYFYSLEEFVNFYSDIGIISFDDAVENSQLVICYPRFPREVNPDEYYSSYDFDELPQEIVGAFEELNSKINAIKEPLSWFPGETRPRFMKRLNDKGKSTVRAALIPHLKIGKEAGKVMPNDDWSFSRWYYLVEVNLTDSGSKSEIIIGPAFSVTGEKKSVEIYFDSDCFYNYD